MILDNPFPAILGKWPAWEQRTIRIQLDNAPLHSKPGKLGKRIAERLAKYSTTVGRDINFVTQPANSPNLNTLNLAFFRAIQSLQYQKPAKNLNKMIEIVHKAYADLPLEDVCKNVWKMAQLVMNQVLLCNGGNNYKLPHIGKLKISVAAIGCDIPMQLPCRALIAGNHQKNADAITAAIVTNNQDTPAHLFLIVVSFRRCPSKCGRYHCSHRCKQPRYASLSLVDCCVFPPPPIVTTNTAICHH